VKTGRGVEEGRKAASATEPHVLDVLDMAAIIEVCAIPAASTFSEQASTGDSSRHNTSKPSDSPRVASYHNGAVFRQDATASGGSRPAGATERATRPVFDDHDLATDVAARPDLPDTVRAGILAMVSACKDLKNLI
jgi:hypothetical protein